LGVLQDAVTEMPEPTLVCIVDDDLSVRRSLCRLIGSHGFRTQTFSSAAEYLGAYRDLGVSCLVLDVHLGRMSGIELLEELRSRGVDTPVVLITAHDEPASEQRARRSNIVSFVRKPFEETAIFEAINRAITGGPKY
jgi:two-component system response regulator FixJ